MKIFCFVLNILFSCALNAQPSSNTIVNDNSSWAILFYGLGAYQIPCNVTTEYVYFDGDSVVANRTYKKVFSCDDELHENIRYEGLIREQDKKIYFLSQSLENEYLLYDFSLEEGMTFDYSYYTEQELTVSSLYVKKSNMIEINGYLRKYLELSFSSQENNWIIDTWIEGIGSLNGILQPCYRLFQDGTVRELLCHYKNDELIYKNPSYSGCYYDKVGDITSIKSTIFNRLTVYPNPVDNILLISSSNETNSFIEITDISGRTLYAKRFDTGKEHSIDVSLFASGLYFLCIYDSNGHTSTFKIIKR